MRRITLFLSSLLCVGLTHAAGLWTPSMSTAPAETPIYVRINVNGTPASDSLEVAAFVDGDCRAVASTAVTLGSGTSSTPAYLLRVMGTAADQNKTITFKSFYNNLVYSFTTTATFTGEYVTPIPLDLYLDAVTGISLVNPISIVAAIPAVHDLSADVSLSYDETTRQNKSTLESELSYVWTPLSTILSVTGNMLTADAVTPPDGIQLNLVVTGPNYGSSVAKMQYSAAASTQVIVTEPVIGVTSISVSPNAITAQVGDNYLTKISELVTVTVLPTDATDKSWTASIETSSTATVSTANIITAPGTLNVTISSNSNPSATAMLAISVPTPVSFRYPAELTLSKLHAVAVNFTNLVGNNFDKSLVSVSFSNALNGEPCATASMADESGMKWNFTGLYVGNYTYQVSYDGQPMQSTGGTSAGVLHIPAEVALNSAGWDWISLYAYCAGQTAYSLTNTGGDYLAWLNTDANNRIIDVRSQNALLYNDAVWGFIGDITELSPAGGMYKVKAAYEDANSCVLNLGAECVPITSTSADYNTIQSGYTWISYPIETATTISQTQLATTAQVGDKIIGKTSSAEFDGTSWLPADFALQPGKGYIYYTMGSGGFRPNFNAPTGSGVKRRSPSYAVPHAESEPSPWQYDASPFSENMPVTAALEGVEEGERFTIGAFVGSECRGEGHAVAPNRFIINVAGQLGETVSFRLYDRVTGTVSPLGERLTYTLQRGSLQQPVWLSRDGVTDGVRSLSGDAFGTSSAYNLSGQRVDAGYRGITIVNGRKVIK